MKQTERVRMMEEKFDKALSAVSRLDEALEGFEAILPEIKTLIAYYESDLWRDDFEADAQGVFPPELKRGVLSEDGIYNLLTDYQRLKEMLDS